MSCDDVIYWHVLEHELEGIPTMIDLWNFSLRNHTHIRDTMYPNRNDHTAMLQSIYNCTWKSYMQNCTLTHEAFMYIKGQCSLQPVPTTAWCNYKISVHITKVAHDGATIFTLVVCDQLMQGKWNSLLRSCLMTNVQSASKHEVWPHGSKSADYHMVLLFHAHYTHHTLSKWCRSTERLRNAVVLLSGSSNIGHSQTTRQS